LLVFLILKCYKSQIILKNELSLKIIIIGAGGFGKEVLSTILECNKIKEQFDILGFVDDDQSLKDSSVNNFPVLGNLNWFLKSDLFPLACYVAIGDPKIRKEIILKLKSHDINFPKIIHPTVSISEHSFIDDGTIIQRGSILSTNIKIGKFANFNSTIGHDCILDDFVTISPGCNVSGENFLEEGVFFGSGVVTSDKLKIGKWSHIGAGSIITKNIPKNSLHFAASGKLKTI